MYIVTASNDDYAKHLGVMLHSLLENLDNKTYTNIFIIESNISSENKFRLQRVVRKFNLEVKFITIDDNFFNSFERKIMHISKETYYRIIIPDLLGKDITKALYLDCDMIVREDISKLWNINIDDYFLAAVEELGIKKKKKETLSIPAESIYFNAGLLLINLQNWRENNISAQVIQYIRDNPTIIKLMDQDALNAVLYDKCLRLDHKWNYTTDIRKRYHIDNPAIIHFTGMNKPWNSEHPFKQEYLKYLNSSLWEQEN
jgi:lipopolysaccharide biosynthesis glycosyltransferase